ncbi:MAG: CHASE3 domain-containing protein, partial [Bacteroidota bacterium]|nr:CHASE3 domain-containing protein [Bacteroidota bacterium]
MTSNRFIYFILSAFIAGCLLLISIQYYSDKNINNLISGNEKLLNELKAEDQLREMERNILSVESKIRGAVATNDTSYLVSVDLQIAETQGYLESLKKISDHDSTVRNINRLIALADQKLILKNLILDSLRRSGRFSSENFKTIMKRRMLSNEINNVSRKVYNSRQRLLDSLSVSISNSGRKARTWGTILILIVLVSGAILFWYTIGRIRHQNHLIHQLDLSEKKIRE